MVASRSRILRLDARASLGPYALAAIINELAPAGSDWKTWSVPDLPSGEAAALESALSGAADQLAHLRQHERAVQDLATNLIQGVAAGAVAIHPTITQTKAG